MSRSVLIILQSRFDRAIAASRAGRLIDMRLKDKPTKDAATARLFENRSLRVAEWAFHRALVNA